MRKSVGLLLVIGILVGLMVSVFIGLLLFNRAPLLQPPGLFARLHIYVTQNVAQTEENAFLPELTIPTYSHPSDEIYLALLDSGRSLGWKLVDEDRTQLRIKWEVTTAYLRFTDDVSAQVTSSHDPGEFRLFVRSRSRIGKADFAANARHIQDLLNAIQSRLGSE